MPSIANREAEKYSEIWSVPDYLNVSPGANMVDIFLDISQEDSPSLRSIVDVGAGSGAASRIFKDKGFSVIGFDLTDVGWRQADITLRTGCLWRGLDVPGMYDYGYCCDVMEHIPTEYTALCVQNILSKCAHAFFSISFLPDIFGPAHLGEHLHLTVKPFIWWRDLLKEVGNLKESRDLIGEGVFYVSKR